MFPQTEPIPARTAADSYADLAEVVLRVARELSFREHRDADSVSLTPANANVMRHVDRNPGTTPSEVADATGVLRSNLSASLRELEKLGFLERSTDPADGRGVRLFSTELAARNLVTVREGWAAHTRQALGDLDGVDAATVLLEQMATGLVRARRAQRAP